MIIKTKSHLKNAISKGVISSFINRPSTKLPDQNKTHKIKKKYVLIFNFYVKYMDFFVLLALQEYAVYLHVLEHLEYIQLNQQYQKHLMA